ncbi:MAG: acyltransferase [Bacteroidota bacterium]
MNTSVQQLRGISALAVVFCHYGSDLNSYPYLSELFNMGQLGVHVFFFISGYIILYSLMKNKYTIKNFFRFLLKRSIRIDPIYLLTILLTLLTFWLFSFISSFKGQLIPFIPQQFLAHVFHVVPFTNWQFYNHIFWTLGIEFQFYLLIGIIYFINDKLIYRITFLLLFSSTIFLTLPKSYYLLTSYAPIFALGMALLHYNMSKLKAYLVVILFCGILICLKIGVLSLILVIIAGLLITYSNKKFKPLTFLGDISYSLYIIHPLVLIYLLGTFKRLNIHFYDDLMKLTINISITIGFAYVLYRLVEKPSISLSKKISYHKR